MKFYMYFMAVFTILELPTIFTGQILDILEGVFSVLTIVALYGYVYHRKILNVLFWKRFFIVSIFTDVAYTCLQIYADIRQPHNQYLELLLPFIIGIALAIPGYVGLYRYTYKIMPNIKDE